MLFIMISNVAFRFPWPSCQSSLPPSVYNLRLKLVTSCHPANTIWFEYVFLFPFFFQSGGLSTRDVRVLGVYVFHFKNDAVFVKSVDDHSTAKSSIGKTPDVYM